MAALAATSLAGCSTNKVEKTEEAAVTTSSDGRDIISGEWKGGGVLAQLRRPLR